MATNDRPFVSIILCKDGWRDRVRDILSDISMCTWSHWRTSVHVSAYTYTSRERVRFLARDKPISPAYSGDRKLRAAAIFAGNFGINGRRLVFLHSDRKATESLPLSVPRSVRDSSYLRICLSVHRCMRTYTRARKYIRSCWKFMYVSPLLKFTAWAGIDHTDRVLHDEIFSHEREDSSSRDVGKKIRGEMKIWNLCEFLSARTTHEKTTRL